MKLISKLRTKFKNTSNNTTASTKEQKDTANPKKR